MKHLKVISRTPARAQDLSLTEILETIVSVISLLEPLLNKDSTA